MRSLQYLEVVLCFLSLTELTRFLLSFVSWSFQVLGKDLMDYGIKSGKSLSLGIPRHPKVIFKGNQSSKLGDAPDGIPSFVFNPSVILLEAIFLFTTWYVFCLERLVWYESLIFSLPQASFLYTPSGRDTHDFEFIRILYVLHLYLLS